MHVLLINRLRDKTHLHTHQDNNENKHLFMVVIILSDFFAKKTNSLMLRIIDYTQRLIFKICPDLRERSLFLNNKSVGAYKILITFYSDAQIICI